MTSKDSGGGLNERLRALPAVDRVIAGISGLARPEVVAAIARRAVDRARAEVRAGGAAPSLEEIVAQARSLLDLEKERRLKRIINATGVLIHTNLGRVPLGRDQLDAVANVASGYSNLEFELSSGSRGNRYAHARSFLTSLTGAESALVVNNNAAAVLLVLSSLCSGREVIISRGELVEIGGEFRIPDVMAASGARLVEVGSTNRTHLTDYARAITADTAAILKVHPSNFRILGFTSTVPSRDLIALAQNRDVLFLNDLGSGCIEIPGEPEWALDEPRVAAEIAAGADVVTFSGDKLLGGPQAGLIAGRAQLIEQMSKHPLLRAVRPDKMTLAALEATLAAYIDGRARELPLWQMALAPLEDLEERAQRMAEKIRAAAGSAVKVEAMGSSALSGGGSLPGTELPSWAVVIIHTERSAAEIHRSLRDQDPAVIARVEDDRVILDMRTVPAEHEQDLVAAALAALS